MRSNSKLRTSKILVILTLALALCGYGAVSAQAEPTIDFGIIAPTPGSIAYGGTGVVGDAPMIGTNIQVDNVVGTDTPFNSGGSLPLGNGVLNFTTGTFSGGTSQWNFASGGTITLDGTLDFDGAGPNLPITATWLTGTLSTATVVPFGGGLNLTFSAFTDLKDPRLIAYFFGPIFDPLTQFSGLFHIDFNASGIAPGSFTSTQLGSGDVLNQVPIPPTALLLGSGLLGLVGLGWRRRKQ